MSHLVLLPVSSHLLKHLDSLLLIIEVVSLGSAVCCDLCLGASSLGSRFHEKAARSVCRGDLGGSMKDSCNLRIHIDELVALDGNLLVSAVDSFIHPHLKGLSDDAVDEVADV